jgi:hypothetical protein
MLISFSALSVLFTSCAKIPGHVISTTTIVKAGTLTFNMNDTTRMISTTTADTVSFNTTTVPVTTVTAKNGQKNLSLVVSFGGNTPGTFLITSLVITIPQTNGTLTTSTNGGSITVDAIKVNGGSISGSFTSVVKVSSTKTVPVTGTFSIQQ